MVRSGLMQRICSSRFMLGDGIGKRGMKCSLKWCNGKYVSNRAERYASCELHFVRRYASLMWL